ncbi:hypothetical protein D1BOALGB6SA_9848 [Olavius sp. associated proteobacterium Delta 1]|nr:hypothetical protein D1BOALGB6SA_9848 [Olavius sp. associated proteobacterium Delta 1]
MKKIADMLTLLSSLFSALLVCEPNGDIRLPQVLRVETPGF